MRKPTAGNTCSCHFRNGPPSTSEEGESLSHSGGGDFPIDHAGLTHLEYLPHNSGGFPVNDQLVSVKNFYKIFTVLLQVLIPKAFPS